MLKKISLLVFLSVPLMIPADDHGKKEGKSPKEMKRMEMMKKKEGSNLVPYSFRHYYSLRGHIAGIDSGSMASSMGHSIEAHHRAYPYSSKASTTNAFKRARERATA